MFALVDFSLIAPPLQGLRADSGAAPETCLFLQPNTCGSIDHIKISFVYR